MHLLVGALWVSCEANSLADPVSYYFVDHYYIPVYVPGTLQVAACHAGFACMVWWWSDPLGSTALLTIGFLG